MKNILCDKRLLIMLLFLAACSPLRGCVESEFQLAPESRLPKWFQIPEGLSRQDVSVTITYYTSGKAKIILLGPGPDYKVLDEVIGSIRWHPLTEKRGFTKYPRYSYLKVKDIEELIEHRWHGNILYVVDYPEVTEQNDRVVLRQELEKKERELARLSNAGDRMLALESISELAFAAGDFERAGKYADELLEWAKENPKHGLVGDALNKGNVMLGRVALRAGNVETSKNYLIAAGKVPSSPSLSTFGPNMSLAKDLLEKGEKDVVLQYLDLVSSFWSMGRKDIAKWKEEIKAGRIPDFGANLDY